MLMFILVVVLLLCGYVNLCTVYASTDATVVLFVGFCRILSDSRVNLTGCYCCLHCCRRRCFCTHTTSLVWLFVVCIVFSYIRLLKMPISVDDFKMDLASLSSHKVSTANGITGRHG